MSGTILRLHYPTPGGVVESGKTIAEILPTGVPPREVYVARISLSSSELRRVNGFTPTPGMPAEVMIQTEERTFFDYITKPIVDSMNRAFREQ